MPKEEVTKVEPEVPKKATEPKRVKVVQLSPEKIASYERAHAIKVAKFLAGGEF